MRKLLIACLALTLTASFGWGRQRGGVALPISGGGGATLVFNYTTFAGSPTTINLAGDASGYINSGIGVPTGTVGTHEAASGWYKTQQNISGGFTSNFTFQFASGLTVPTITGITFGVQDSTNNGSPEGFYGDSLSADANLAGYGWYNLGGQYQAINSIGLVFSLSSQNIQTIDYTPSSTTSMVGLYLVGGPQGNFVPEQDLKPYGLNLYSGDVFSANVVYDGSTLTLVLKDTTTSAQGRFTWPLNIPDATGSNSNWVGFMGADGPDTSTTNTINSWNYYTGYNTRLTTPTLSPAGGSYGSSQTVTINCPSGATCYYTTNGLTPTTASTQYTSPITVSANEYVQAVAVESNFTDSFVGSANYLISASNTINFGSGFSGSSSLITTIGDASLSGSTLYLNTAIPNGTYSQYGSVGATWYVAPVTVSSFNTTFVFNSSGGSGICFVVQNQNGTSTDSTALAVTGGPFSVGGLGTGYGYSQQAGTGIVTYGFQTSVATCFNIQSNKIVAVNDGALPSGGTTISGVTLNSGHHIQVSLSYSSGTITANLEDLTTLGTAGPYTFSEDISTLVGSPAYVGFTGASPMNGSAPTQNAPAQQLISWTY